MRRIWLDSLVLLLLCAAAPLWLALAYSGHRSVSFAVDALSVMLPTTGFHDLEPLVDRPGFFRWTTGAALLQPPNPGGPLYLRMSLSSGLSRATPLVLRAEGSAASFSVQPGLQTYSLLLPTQPGERVQIRIESPTQKIDGRNLGVVFHTLYVSGDGPAPLHLLVAMLLATAGIYPLLRRAGMHSLVALMCTLALQVAAAAGQRGGLWEYGLLGQLLVGGGAAALAALVIERVWPPMTPSPPAPLPHGERGDSTTGSFGPPSPSKHIFTHIFFYRSTMRFIGSPGGRLKSPLGSLRLGVGQRRRRNRPRRRAASRRLPWRDVSRPLCAPPMGESLDSRRDVGRDMPSKGEELGLRGGRATIKPLLVLLLLALAMCLPWLGAPDPVGDMKLSARRMGVMYEQGGFSQAFTNGGDYMPFRLYILRGLSYLVEPLGGAFYDPVPVVTQVLIKLPSIMALLATVALLYGWARRYGGPRRAALVAGLYAVIPPVWMNVAWWGQVDVLLALPMVAAVALFDTGRGRWSWLCWAAGVMVKPQAIILAPLLYVLTLRRYGARGLVEGGALAAGLIGLACAPFVMIDQGPGLYQAAAGAVGRFPQVTNRAYNLWWLVADDAPISDLRRVAGMSYRSIGFALVALTAGLTSLAALRRPDGPSRAAAAATLAMAFFALPTQIHERYAFFALPFLLLCAAADWRALLPFGLLTLTATINIIGAIPGFFPDVQTMIARSSFPRVVAWANMAILLGMLIFMWLNHAPRSADSDAPG